MIDMTKSIKSIFSFASSFQNLTFENCPLVFGLLRMDLLVLFAPIKFIHG